MTVPLSVPPVATSERLLNTQSTKPSKENEYEQYLFLAQSSPKRLVSCQDLASEEDEYCEQSDQFAPKPETRGDPKPTNILVVFGCVTYVNAPRMTWHKYSTHFIGKELL